AEIADAGPYAPMPLGLTACRVDVGGALPSGTDAVVPLDAITLRGDRAEATAPLAPGEGVLAPGADATPAIALRHAGERLRALDLAAMAAAGIAEVTIRSPRLALARATAARTPVLNAAQAMLSRCAAKAGCAVSEASALAEALSEGQCDAVIGIGGTGSGRRDDAVQELARRGRIEAYGIAICPGETAAFGFFGERPVLLVPGRLDVSAVSRGECDIAPVHLVDAASGVYNKHLLTPGLALVPGWRRMQGFVFRPGDARFEGRSAEGALQAALADPAILMVNRNAGSARAFLSTVF